MASSLYCVAFSSAVSGIITFPQINIMLRSKFLALNEGVARIAGVVSRAVLDQNSPSCRREFCTALRSKFPFHGMGNLDRSAVLIGGNCIIAATAPPKTEAIK